MPHDMSISSVMTTLRKALMAAIGKSVLRGKSLLQLILALWTAPATEATASSKTKHLPQRSVQDFLKEAEDLFLSPISGDGLLRMSSGLRAQFLEGLSQSEVSMLPSYNHQLPSGNERGQYLAIDMGGTSLRIALIELRGRGAPAGTESEVVKMNMFKVDKHAKSLEGMAFFDWLADRIIETISSGLRGLQDQSQPLPLSLAWSFPIEQTSLKGGRIHAMGKGLRGSDGLQGQDLGQVIKFACHNKGLEVELQAILNDSAACLLSQSYKHLSTRFGLILGTGTNIGFFMPVSAIGRSKFGERPASWFEQASQVIVNAELGMYGKNVLPLTRWDMQLKDGHPKPWFQPLEHMVSGMYLGECCRLVLLEAVETTGVLGGVVPESLQKPYGLDTETLSLIESDASPTLSKAIKIFSDRHPSPVEPTTSDLQFLKLLASFISRRSSAITATCVYTLWDLRSESAAKYAQTLPADSVVRKVAEAEAALPRTVVAFNGAVIENYPGYLSMCQGYLDGLVKVRCGENEQRTIDLVEAKESSLFGAAIALACVEGQE